MIDWNDPAARAALIERVGVGSEAYNKAFTEYFGRPPPLAIINGYPIRKVKNQFGSLYSVGKLTFPTFEAAAAHARAH